MKIFTSTQIHELDRYTIEHEPIASLNLMERAAKAITRSIEEEWSMGVGYRMIDEDNDTHNRENLE